MMDKRESGSRILACSSCFKDTPHRVFTKKVFPECPPEKSGEVQIGKELFRKGLRAWQRPYQCQEFSCKGGDIYTFTYQIATSDFDRAIEFAVKLQDEIKLLKSQLAELKRKLQTLANEIPD